METWKATLVCASFKGWAKIQLYTFRTRFVYVQEANCNAKSLVFSVIMYAIHAHASNNKHFQLFVMKYFCTFCNVGNLNLTVFTRHTTLVAKASLYTFRRRTRRKLMTIFSNLDLGKCIPICSPTWRRHRHCHNSIRGN